MMNVVLKSYKKHDEHLELAIHLEQGESRLPEAIKLELTDADSKKSVAIGAKKFDHETQIATFALNVADFRRLIDEKKWFGVGWVEVRIDGQLITKTENTKLDADFAMQETADKSFVITPHFVPEQGLAFGTAIVETEIFNDYILKEKKRMPIMDVVKRRYACYYAAKYDETTLDEHVILYDSRNGQSITCSPYAIFKYLIDNPQYQNYRHYWTVRADLIDEIKAMMPTDMLDKMVLVVKYSKEYFDILLTAKYLIVNGSCLQAPFKKKTGQISVNTWHGVPIKHMAFDTPASGIPRFRNVLRQFMALDYLISPNAHTTDVMTNAYKLHDLFQGEILEYGYPRMDVIVQDEKNIDKQQALGNNIELDNQLPTLIYMPTWRGGNTKRAADDVEEVVLEAANLITRLSHDYNVLIKVHPFLYEHVKNDSRLQGALISDFRDPNEVLSAADVLVSDYSSVFFDFLPTKKPIVYYMKDREDYENNRGLYISPDVLPGPVATDFDELVERLKHLATTDLVDDSDVRAQFTSDYSTYDDGLATQRVVERIFDGVKPAVGRTLKLTSDKKKVLITIKSLRPSTTTDAYLRLTNNIDFNQYDVTQLCKLDDEDRINVPHVNRHVRQMFSTGTTLFSAEERILVRHYAGRASDNSRLESARQREKGRLVPIDAFDFDVQFDEVSSENFENFLRGKKSLAKRLSNKFFKNK